MSCGLAIPVRGATPPAAGRPWGVYVALGVLGTVMLFGISLPRGHGALFPTQAPHAPLQAARQIRFAELAHDELVVSDAANGRVVARLAAEQNGFLHAVVHGLSVTRRHDSVPVDLPYGLALYRDGRLVLSDPPTGVSIDVEGFGPTNEAGLLAFLAPEGPGA